MKALIFALAWTTLILAEPRDREDSIVFPDEFSDMMKKPRNVQNRNSERRRPSGNSTIEYQLPLNFARMFAETNDINDFVEKVVTNKEKFQEDLAKENPAILVASRFGASGGNRKTPGSKLAQKAMCIPQPEVVSLIPENHDPSNVYIPDCTRINRCSGCCGTALLSCNPTKTAMRTFKIYALSFNKEMTAQYKKMINVNVEEHLECKCGCSQTSEDCRAEHEFMVEECMCGCGRNLKEARAREEACTSVAGRSWSHSTCTCNDIDSECLDMLH